MFFFSCILSWVIFVLFFVATLGGFWKSSICLGWRKCCLCSTDCFTHSGINTLTWTTIKFSENLYVEHSMARCCQSNLEVFHFLCISSSLDLLKMTFLYLSKTPHTRWAQNEINVEINSRQKYIQEELFIVEDVKRIDLENYRNSTPFIWCLKFL